MVELEMFQPTGLLGGDIDMHRPEDAEPTSNGLLGLAPSPLVSAGMLENRPSGELQTSFYDTTEQTLVEEAFTSNGLLGTTQSNDLLQSCSPLSQDDSLPNVSQILREYGNPAKSSDIPADSLFNGDSAAERLARISIKATTYDGKPLYIRRKREIRRRDPDSSSRQQQMGNLLDVPLHRLMDQLSLTTATKLANPENHQEPSRAKISQDKLWVDRYRPRVFADLLGDERVHRETMAWVKEWDWCVFGKKKGKKRARDDQDLDYNDEFHRPRERILLLSGPPGLGKTTLAHVVAKQAGYAVFEINASDARSGQIVDDRIRPALEAGAAVGGTKPVLVVIDEIDGATGSGENVGGFVHKLVELTSDKPRKKRGKKDPSANRPLLRPIICICNDLYASSLAKLRQHARIVRFNRPADIYIVKRLREICENEALKADSRALTALVGVAKGDLRGCLNTLQFVKARNQEVTETTIRAATIGMKEADTSMTSVLNDLFSPMSKKRVKEAGLTEEEETRYVDRLSREVDGSGSTDKVAMGCFEHYANLRRHDATFSRYEKANRWLTAYDHLSGAMRSEREYSLMPYLSYFLVPFYTLFQERGTPKVERPKDDYENYLKTKTNEEIYQSLSRCLRLACGRRGGDYRHLASEQVLRLEFAPYINRIISPPLRPVNRQVIRPEEKALLSRLVDVMVSMDLQFIQDKGEDAQLVYRLEPPIDVFVTYDGKRTSDISASRYAVRQLVAAEVEAQSIVNHAVAVDKYRNSFAPPEEAQDESRGDTEGVEQDGKLMRPYQLPPSRVPAKDTLADIKVDIADRPPVDFFGRPITKPIAPSGKGGSGSAPQTKYRVSYKFHEGNSAAVRKPVKMASFML
ncbi:P-loop containing nucleoside triphosphate hydrolase protein [Heliocybe sulcata]|uniref:P-loop containing nucleoside triphosphate hydrolase protein n=1 Tax=Heliocybe sulcata TaxID=5364 RepID=A0A5C3NCK3_9AGAM|nr:P-loop containing nucleoside triphosphate hydrolase protein [Heliocybe sulcata]